MASWQDIQKEVEESKSFDKVRRAKYKNFVEITKRPLVVYASAFIQPMKNQFQPLMALDLTDKDGFEQVINGLNTDKVDILLHSPGGSAEATESIVKIIRNKIKNVRFIITGVAKSAATMLALSGDSILMTKAAEVGPIDPQIRVRDRFSPAGSIIEQFEEASKQIKKNPEILPAWIPVLQEYAPCLLVDCANYIELSETLVKTWMQKYMFSENNSPQNQVKIDEIAKYLTNEKKNLSHARRIGYEELKEVGVKVELAENQGPKFSEALNEVHLALMQTLAFTDAVKIFENSEDQALVLNVKTTPIPINQ